jgi:hypothetical protein
MKIRKDDDVKTYLLRCNVNWTWSVDAAIAFIVPINPNEVSERSDCPQPLS